MHSDKALKRIQSDIDGMLSDFKMLEIKIWEKKKLIPVAKFDVRYFYVELVGHQSSPFKKRSRFTILPPKCITLSLPPSETLKKKKMKKKGEKTPF